MVLPHYHPRHPDLPSYSRDRDLDIADLHSVGDFKFHGRRSRAPSPPSISPWTARLCRPPPKSDTWVSFTCPTCAHRPFCFSGASLPLAGTWPRRRGSPPGRASWGWARLCARPPLCRACRVGRAALRLLHHAARAAAGRRWCGKGQLAGGRGRGGRRRGRGGGRGGRRQGRGGRRRGEASTEAGVAGAGTEREERVERKELTGGPHCHVSAKPPSKTAGSSIMNGFHTWMVKNIRFWSLMAKIKLRR